MNELKIINSETQKKELFFQLPSWLFTNNKYNNLSVNAKLTYALIKDRYNLSLYTSKTTDIYKDKDGFIFFKFSIKSFMEQLNVSNKVVVKIKDELIKAKLLEQEFVLGKTNHYYLLKPDLLNTNSKRFNDFDLQEEKFYQIPKWLIFDNKYSLISNGAKILYSLFKDRYLLSLANASEDFMTDDTGEVYFHFKREELAHLLNITERTATKYKQELLEIGLLKEKTVEGNNLQYYLKEPQRISCDLYYTKQLQTLEPVEKGKKYTTRREKSTRPEGKKVHTSNTEYNNTENNNIKDIVNKEKKSVTKSENNSILINDLKTTEKEKTNLSLKERLIDTCNTNYTKFAIGRWNKKEWNTLINAFVEETIRENRKIDNLPAYVYGALSTIAYKHDLKNDKLDFEYTY